MYQLVYISKATADFSAEDLDTLLAKARSNNAQQNVTGMLLYHEGSFIQALEGEEERVDAIFNKIETDSRHTDAHIVLRTKVEERAFADWSMGYLRTNTADDLPDGFHHFLKVGYRRQTDADDQAARKALLAFKEGRWRL